MWSDTQVMGHVCFSSDTPRPPTPSLGPDLDLREFRAAIQDLSSTLSWRFPSSPFGVLFLGLLPHFAGAPAPVASWDTCAWEVHCFKPYRFEMPLVCPPKIKSLAGNRSWNWKAFLPLFWRDHFLVFWFPALLVRNLIPFSLLIFACDFIPWLHKPMASSLYSGCSDNSRLSTLGWLYFHSSCWCPVGPFRLVIYGLNLLKIFLVLVYW